MNKIHIYCILKFMEKDTRLRLMNKLLNPKEKIFLLL